MKRTVSFILALLAMLSMLAGCNRGQISDETQKPVNEETDPIRTEETEKAESAEDDKETEKNDKETTAPVEIDFAQAAKDMFTDRDYEIGYSDNECILIELTHGSSMTAFHIICVNLELGLGIHTRLTCEAQVSVCLL